LEWLHQGCDSDLSADFLNFGATNFLFKNPFKKCFQIVFWLQESFSFDLYTDSILKQLNKLKL
jgi:hypothetical protein